ncbi:MAG: hypothetical protein SPI15_00330 [Candidatus Faecousia sp.]|nr:hypothetical protein [Clostridiales bacterium]MDY6179277.1 hypothetical protein [Candidatus Faecousia sp.]
MIVRNKNWVFLSAGALVLSLLSLFLPVVTYTTGIGRGVTHSYNIVQLLDGESFVENVLGEYHGSFLFGLSAGAANAILVLLCVIGAAAIPLSAVGLRSMAKQYESAWPFRLTLTGILCTAIPAVALLIAVMMSGAQFPGDLRPGAYLFVTPAAMAVSCATVVKRHRLTQEELRIRKAAAAYIRPAGDLPLQ